FLADEASVKPSRGLTPEGAFWLFLTANVDSSLSQISLELRQLRGRGAEFWQIETEATASRSYELRSVRVTQTRSGIAFEGLSVRSGALRLVGRIRGESVVKPQVVLQPGPTLENHLIASDRLGGLLFGGML